MFLLTYIVIALIAILSSLGLAIGSSYRSAGTKIVSKERMDYYRTHEQEWINKPTCPVFRVGNKLMCIADRQYDQPFLSVRRGTEFEVYFGYDRNRNEYGLIHAPSGKLLFTTRHFINWKDETSTIWVPILGWNGEYNRYGGYRCNACGYFVQYGSASSCNCGRRVTNQR